MTPIPPPTSLIPDRHLHRGQAMVEYLIVTLALVAGGVGLGLFGEGGGVMQMLLDALRAFHHRFAITLSLPL